MPLDKKTFDQLKATMTVDLTTVGRSSGLPRTIEIWWFHVEGRFIITGTPGPRDWLANVRSDPGVVISCALGDFAGTAVEIADSSFRRNFFSHPNTSWYKTQAELAELIETAPMIEVVLIDA